jgi:hypothetical protein
MEKLFIISWIISLIISIIYTFFTFKKRTIEMFNILLIVWFATITCGYILGFVFLVFFIYIFLEFYTNQ